MAFEHRHDLFEEARIERVNSFKREAVRDNLPLPSVSYYRTINEQNQFLHNIENTQFGKSLIEIQHRFNVEMGIPLILPKFNNLKNISLSEQQFLGLQGLAVQKDRQGNYGIGIQGTPKGRSKNGRTYLFEQLALNKGKAGAYYQFIEPSDYYISIGAVPESLLKKIEKQKRPLRVFGKTPEPTVVTGVKPFEKPERVSVFKTEPKITTVSKAPIEILPMAAAEPEPIITISPKIKKIIDDWSVKKIIVPSWFANNNMNWVLQGKITEAEFLAAYNNLVKTGVITIDLDFNGVSTPVTTQGGEEILITEPTEPAKPIKPAEALPIGFTGIIAGLIVLGGLFSWGDHKRRNK